MSALKPAQLLLISLPGTDHDSCLAAKAKLLEFFH